MILALELVSYHYKLGFFRISFQKVLGFFLTIDNYLPIFIWPLISNPNWPTNFSCFYCHLKTIIIYLSFASYRHSRKGELYAQVGMSTRECVFKFLEVSALTTISFAYAFVFSPSTPKFCVFVVCIGFGLRLC